VSVDRVAEIVELEIAIEVAGEDAHAVVEGLAQACAHDLGLRVKVSLAAENSLPRSELKATRVTDRRTP
jgi:phenylacetate-coenzyme A ligase PaaK-like adenylate-forming protein